ncbi:MAG: type II secretion system protein [Fibrobacter sp.]|nr:type II secretion system protein [Fibrobacter sp.]
MKYSGFTLMEVLVALAVLGGGSAVFLRFADGFLQLRDAERREARAFLCATRTMEYFVHGAVSCQSRSGEKLFPEGDTCGATTYSLTQVPGLAPLLLVDVISPAIHPIKFRRLVQCEKNPALR